MGVRFRNWSHSQRSPNGLTKGLRLPVVAISVLLLSVSVLWEIAKRLDQPETDWEHLETTAWLPISDTGFVGLYDGLLPDQVPLARVPVAETNSRLSVLPVANGAIVLDGATGQLHKLDTAQRDVVKSDLLPAIEAADIVGSDESMWVLADKQVLRLDPESGSQIAGAIEIPNELIIDRTIDDQGALWIATDSSVTTVSADGSTTSINGRHRLGSVDGEPILLEPETGAMTFTNSGKQCTFDSPPTARLAVTKTLAVVLAEQQPATIVDQDCQVAEIDGTGAPGSADRVVESDGWLYLANTESGQLWMAEVDGGTVGTILRASTGGPLADLLTIGEFVFVIRAGESAVSLARPGAIEELGATSIETGSYTCVGPSAKAYVDQTIQFEARRATDQQPVAGVTWYLRESRSEPIATGPRLAIQLDEPGTLDVYFTSGTERIACEPVEVTDAPPPITVSVNPDGSGDYATLREAVEAVPPDSQIDLSSGDHNIVGQLVLWYPIEIRGEGELSTRLISSRAEVSAIDVRNVGLRLRSLNLLNRSAAGGVHLILATDAELDLADVTIAEATGDGIRLSGRSSGTLTNVTLTKNRGHGLVAEDRSNLLITEATASENGEAGFVWSGAATGELTNNRAQANGGDGFLFTGRTETVLVGNQASTNAAGFAWHGNASGSTQQDVAEGNRATGFVMAGSSRVTHVESRANANQSSGFQWQSDASGSATACLATNNEAQGFTVSDRAEPDLIRNVARGNQKSGFVWFGESGGSATANEARSNRAYGFGIADRSTPTLRSNEAADNDYDGYWTGDDASPLLTPDNNVTS